MSPQSLFSKKNIKAYKPDEQRGLLEELNLPPAIIAFIRNNARSLQIGLVCVVIVALASVFYEYYSKKQEMEGASLLASALQAESTELREQGLENVVKDYGRTNAALWSRIELAHLDYKEGRYDAAAAKYEKVLDKLPAANPLVPLTRLNLAQSYEQIDQYDKALAQYDLLKKSPGFQNQAYWGLGRIYIAKEDPMQARKVYEELLNNLGETPDQAVKARLEAKLASLQAAIPVDVSQPAGNKE